MKIRDNKQFVCLVNITHMRNYKVKQDMQKQIDRKTTLMKMPWNVH